MPIKKTPEQIRKYRRDYMRRKRLTDPEFAHRSKLNTSKTARKRAMKNVGLTEEDYHKILEEQGGCCPICSTPLTATVGLGSSRAGKPHIDHDHVTGKMRGLLCHLCNSLLGHARDNQTILLNARKYLDDRGVNAIRKGWAGTVAGKVWGETYTMLQTPIISMHRLVIKPNSQCSMHLHKNKWNSFIVLSGLLYIEVEKSGYPLTDITTLREGGIVSVQPGEYHRFRTGDEPAEALEFYYPEPLSEDIIRKDVGGKA